MSGVALNTDQTLDVWKVTLESHQWKNKDLDYLFPLHNWVALDLMFAKDRIVPESGTQIKRQLIYRENGSTRWVNPGEVRTRSTIDVVTEITLPFVGAAGEHSILSAEIRRNANRAKLKSLAAARRATATMDMGVELESKFWAMPETSNNKYPYGMPYWIVPITGAQVTAGTDSGAHQGGRPAGFTAVAGIDPEDATFSRWQSYNASWSNASADITETDVQRMGKMFRHLKWRAPMIATDVKQPKFDRLRIYTDETIIDNYSKFVRTQRDDLGSDGGKYYGAGLNGSGEPLFKGLNLIWVEELDTADTTNRGANPLYMINHNYYYPVVEEGTYFREDVPMRSVDQPDLFTTWVDLNFNILCDNRQLGGGLISYVAAA